MSLISGAYLLGVGSQTSRFVQSRSEFMPESAYQKAQEVLLDQTFFGLNEAKFQQFIELLDAPPAQNEKLQALLITKAPWD